MQGLCTPEQLVRFLNTHRNEFPVPKLAAQSGIGESTIYALLAGSSIGSLKVDTLTRLVEAIGCRVVIAVGAKANPLIEHGIDESQETKSA